MSVEATPSIEAMLISDDYWSGPVLDPLNGMSREERTQYYRDIRGIYTDQEKAQEIGNIVLSLKGGGSMQHIAGGETIPLPSDNPRQVVKIVEDTRTILPRFKPKPKYYGQLKRREKLMRQLANERVSYFDDIAELMSQPNAYIWVSAVSIVKRSRDLLVVQRSVGYMRAGRGNLGAVLLSSCIGDDEVAERAHTAPMPQLAVGAIYKDGHNTLSKITSAAVMEARGVRWTHNKRGSVKKGRERQKLSWLPSFEISN